MYTGPGVRPGERDADDDDVALQDDETALTGQPAERNDPPPNESRPATTSVAPDALDEDSSDD